MRRTSSISTPVAHLVGPGKLKVVNGQLAFSDGATSPLRLDPQELRTLLCYGPVGITDEAFQVLFRHGVDVTWLTPAGTVCRGRLVHPDAPTTVVRLLQHRAFQDAEQRRLFAGGVVAAKVQSQMEATRHYQRHGCAAAGPVLQQLADVLAACAGAAVERLRGLEGAASAAWFGLLGQLLNPPWQFVQRVRRPPTDPVNALLSLGYTWLLTRTRARCEAAGLEVYLGALHEYRAGRPSLACDLMEPLRVPTVDRWMLGLCNRGQVTPEDFVADARGGMRLRDGLLGRILHHWEEHWLNGGHEATLNQGVQTLLTWLRRGVSPGDTAAADAP